MCAEVGGFEVGDGEQRADAGVRLAASDAGKAVVDEDAVVVVKRDEVGDGAEGDEVEAGQVLLVLEAMKMETEITAPAAGTVSAILVKPGEPVQGGQGLIEL